MSGLQEINFCRSEKFTVRIQLRETFIGHHKVHFDILKIECYYFKIELSKRAHLKKVINNLICAV